MSTTGQLKKEKYNMLHEFNQFHELKIEYHYFVVLFKYLCTHKQNKYTSLTVELLNNMCVKTHTDAEKYLMQFKNSMFLDGIACENNVFGAYYLASGLKHAEDEYTTIEPEQVANTIISNRIDHLLRFIDFNLTRENSDFDYQYFMTPEKQHDMYNFVYGQIQKYIEKAVQKYKSQYSTEMNTRGATEHILDPNDIGVYYNDALEKEFNKLHSIKVVE